jgi:hypothetical protein
MRRNFVRLTEIFANRCLCLCLFENFDCCQDWIDGLTVYPVVFCSVESA